MVTHLAFIIRNGEKQKTPALNNKERRKVKSTQKKQRHTYLIDGRTYISNSYFYTCYTIFLKTYQNSISISIFFAETEIKHTITISNIWSCSENLAQGYFSKLDLHWNQSGNCSIDKFYKTGVKNFFFKIWFYL